MAGVHPLPAVDLTPRPGQFAASNSPAAEANTRLVVGSIAIADRHIAMSIEGSYFAYQQRTVHPHRFIQAGPPYANFQSRFRHTFRRYT